MCSTRFEALRSTALIFTVSLLSLDLSVASLQDEHVRTDADGSRQADASLALLGLLLRPAHLSRTPMRTPRSAVRMEMDRDVALRTLGVIEDASQEEINEQFDMLSKRYSGDDSKIAQLTEAKEALAAASLKSALARAKTTAQNERWDTLKLTKQRQFAKDAYSDYSNKILEMPSRKQATKVVATLGGLSLLGWVAPSAAPMAMLLNTVSAVGFMYNKGEREVPRDSQGNPGEVTPMKKKPLLLAVLISSVLWLFAFLRAQSIINAAGTLPKGFDASIRSTVIACALLLPSLFLKVQWIQDVSFGKFWKRKKA